MPHTKYESSSITGEKIRQQRKAKGLTQKELADKAGLSTMSIRRYENGERIAPEEVLKSIACALNLQDSFFLDKLTSKTVALNYDNTETVAQNQTAQCIIDKTRLAPYNVSRIKYNLLDLSFNIECYPFKDRFHNLVLDHQANIIAQYCHSLTREPHKIKCSFETEVSTPAGDGILEATIETFPGGYVLKDCSCKWKNCIGKLECITKSRITQIKLEDA